MVCPSLSPLVPSKMKSILKFFFLVFPQELFSPGLFSNIDSQMSVGHGFSYDTSLRSSSSREKKWLVGLQVSSHFVFGLE